MHQQSVNLVVSSPPPAVEVNTGAMLAMGASAGAIRLACDLIQHVWWPGQSPISFAIDDLHARLEEAVPERNWNHWRLRRYRAWAQVFFREADAGLWVPAPEFWCRPLPRRGSSAPQVFRPGQHH